MRPEMRVEILTAAGGHEQPNQRLSGALVTDDWTTALQVDRPVPGTRRAVATVTNDGDRTQVLLAVALTVEVGEADGLELLDAAGDWTAEGRWRRRPLADELVDIGGIGKGCYVRRSLGTWSTADALPVGVLVDRGRGWALAWQIEHNGPWRWELARDGAQVRLSLSGPTDVDHGWSQPVPPGGSFTTVPVALAEGADADDAVGRLTAYRRATRRPHPDHQRLALVFNDYMNTLDGDPSTARLLPLVDAAAEVGAEVFCIDAGWYDDSGSWWDGVGEWQPSTVRFPGGLGEVLDRIRGHQMVPGLWLEPEVVGVRSPVADRLPPAAFLSRHGVRVREGGRYHLDLRHPAARAHLDATVDRLVAELGIGYLKCDYNTNPGAGTDHDAPSPGAGLLGHCRAVLAWYDGVLDRHPELIIENCGSGAMRADWALLSRLQLQSTTDQEDLARYAPIAVSAPMLVLPEQAGSWAYPDLEMDDEATAFSLSLGLLGRLYLSGFLDRVRPTQRRLVDEAVAVHRALRAGIPDRTPVWPWGLPGWDDPWLAYGLRGSADTLLTVFRRGGPGSVSVPVPGATGVEPVFPTSLPSWQPTLDDGVLRLSAPAGPLAARTFRLTGTI